MEQGKKVLLVCSADLPLDINDILLTVDKISHIIYGPFIVEADGEWRIKKDENLEKLFNLKCKYRWIKSIARFGGAVDNSFFSQIKFSNSRTLLVKETLRQLQLYGFDGINIDIDHRHTRIFEPIFAFIKELKQSFSKGEESFKVTYTIPYVTILSTLNKYLRDIAPFVDIFCVTECDTERIDQTVKKLEDVGLQQTDMILICKSNRLHENIVPSIFSLDVAGFGMLAFQSEEQDKEENQIKDFTKVHKVLDSLFMYVDKVDNTLNRIQYSGCKFFCSQDDSGGFIRVPIVTINKPQEKDVLPITMKLQVTIDFDKDKYTVNSKTVKEWDAVS